jgi:hypothetical protein
MLRFAVGCTGLRRGGDEKAEVNPDASELDRDGAVAPDTGSADHSGRDAAVADGGSGGSRSEHRAADASTDASTPDTQSCGPGVFDQSRFDQVCFQ